MQEALLQAGKTGLPNITLFDNRQQAGQLLGLRLKAYGLEPLTVVVGIARRGIPVAYEVASVLHLPLDVCVIRKLTYPYRPEILLGAVSRKSVVIVNSRAVQELRIPDYQIDALADEQERALECQEAQYRRTHAAVDLFGKTALLVDDTVGSGATMLASDPDSP